MIWISSNVDNRLWAILNDSIVETTFFDFTVKWSDIPILYWIVKTLINPISPGLFLEPVTPGRGLFDPPSNFKTTKAIDTKLWPNVDNYKKFQFELFLENFILLFVSYDVIKFKTIEKNGILNKFISKYLQIIIEHNLSQVALIQCSLC